MRRPALSDLLLGLLLLSAPACDLQPPKHDAPASAPAPATPPVTATPPGPPPAAVIADAGAAPAPTPEGAAAGSGQGSAAPAKPPAVEPTQVCTDVAVHIAEIVIGSIKDPAQKAALEQDRTKLVRRAAETCTLTKWSEVAQKCFLAAKDAPALEECGKQLASP